MVSRQRYQIFGDELALLGGRSGDAPRDAGGRGSGD